MDEKFAVRVMTAILDEARAGTKIKLKRNVEHGNLHLPTMDALIQRQNKPPRYNDDDDDATGNDSDRQSIADNSTPEPLIESQLA